MDYFLEWRNAGAKTVILFQDCVVLTFYKVFCKFLKEIKLLNVRAA